MKKVLFIFLLFLNNFSCCFINKDAVYEYCSRIHYSICNQIGYDIEKKVAVSFLIGSVGTAATYLFIKGFVFKTPYRLAKQKFNDISRSKLKELDQFKGLNTPQIIDKINLMYAYSLNPLVEFFLDYRDIAGKLIEIEKILDQVNLEDEAIDEENLEDIDSEFSAEIKKFEVNIRVLKNDILKLLDFVKSNDKFSIQWKNCNDTKHPIK